MLQPLPLAFVVQPGVIPEGIYLLGFANLLSSANVFSANVLLQMFFFKCSSANALLQIFFCKCSSANVLLQMLFCKCSSANVLLQMFFCKCSSANVVLQMFFCKCFETCHAPLCRRSAGSLLMSWQIGLKNLVVDGSESEHPAATHVCFH